MYVVVDKKGNPGSIDARKLVASDHDDSTVAAPGWRRLLITSLPVFVDLKNYEMCLGFQGGKADQHRSEINGRADRKNSKHP